MGSKQVKEAKSGEKNSGKEKKAEPIKLPAKDPNLVDIDYEFFQHQTGLSRDEIESIFGKFKATNPDMKLNKKEFVSLYESLRPEPVEQLNEIAEYVFNAFDANHDKSIEFQEFLVAYALTSRGDVKKKLDYAFALYDADQNGYLDSREIRTVLIAMLDLLGADKRSHNISKLTDECMSQLDLAKEGRVSKDEFVNGLLRNYSLRSLMSPFN